MAINMEKLVKDWFAAWNSRDPQKTIQFYTDDAIFDNVALGKVVRGKNETLTYLKALFTDYPDFKIEQKETYYSANAVCGEAVLSATQVNNTTNPTIPATGKHYSVRGGYLSEWQNGKVKRHVFFEDLATVLRQLGLMPSTPAK